MRGRCGRHVFATRNQPRLNDRVRIVGASSVVDVLGEVVREQHVVLQCRIDVFSSKVAPEFLECTVRDQHGMDPRNAGISFSVHLLFANNSVTLELTNAEKTRILRQVSVPKQKFNCSVLFS